jgi:hypothetical protein
MWELLRKYMKNELNTCFQQKFATGAYEKWVYFFEKFYVDGEEEIVMRQSGFIFFYPIDNFL